MKNIASFFIKGYRQTGQIIALLALVFLSAYSVSNATNYMFFSVNGDTSANSMVQGDTVGWGSNCGTGAALMWEIWFDANSNTVIDTLSDRQVAEFQTADGDTYGDQGPPDFNPVPDGWYITPPMLLGIAPGHYVFKVTDLSDQSTVQKALSCTAMPSPPNVFRGRVTVEGHPAPDTTLLRYIWIEAGLNGQGDQMWAGLTDQNGLYEINVGNAGTGLEFRIGPNDLSGFVNPGYLLRTASGIVDSVNFAYTLPSDSIYGEIKDQNGSLLLMPIYVNCGPRFGGPNEKHVLATDGTFAIYFGPSERGQWELSLNLDDVVPGYLGPDRFVFNNDTLSSLRHDLICYIADAELYARVTELGNPPTHQYRISAQSNTIDARTESVSGTGNNNVATLHISSVDQSSWSVAVSSWDNRYPIPPGYVLEGFQNGNLHPGDTVSLNFISGISVHDNCALDAGDPPIVWNNVWAYLNRPGFSYGNWPDSTGAFTIYADTGTYSMGAASQGYLTDPFSRTVHVTGDTAGGLGFTINQAQCRVTGSLVNIPIPLQYSVSVNARTGNQETGYLTWGPVDSLTGTYVAYLCDGNWTLDPPSLPNYISPPPAAFTVSEYPDTARIVNFIYSPTGVDDGDNPLPSDFVAHQNYPNPFNAQTTIEYGLPRASEVTIEIFDLLGRRLETFRKERQEAGYYQFTWDAGGQPSGIYFYRVATSGWEQVKKMLLLK